VFFGASRFVAQHELDLLMFLDLDLAGNDQHLAIGFRHRNLHGSRRLVRIARLAGRECVALRVAANNISITAVFVNFLIPKL
jgi:hypothetical protein